MSDAGKNPSFPVRGGRLKGTAAFTALCVGQMVSLFGSHLTSFVLGVWVYQLTKSATNFALIYFFASVPELILSPLAGALVDRWDRRWLMIIGNLGAALATFTLILSAMSGRMTVWFVYLVVALNSAFQAVQYPALSASTSLLVPPRHLSRANGAVEFGNALAFIVAPVTAALFLASIGFSGVFLLNVVTFAFAIAVLLASRVPGPLADAGATGGAGLLRQAGEGWRYIKARPEFLGLIIFFAAINFTFGVVQVLLPPLILSFASSFALGTVMTCAGSGSLGGSLIITLFGTPKRKVRAMLLLAFTQGLVLFLGVWRLSVPLIGAAAFLFSVCAISNFVLSQTIWQTEIPQEIQGRAFAIRRLIVWSTLPVAYFAAGPLADKVFEPMLASTGILAPSVGSIIGTGPGRGIAFLFVVLGGVMVTAVCIAGRYGPFWELESRMLDGIQGAKKAQQVAASQQEQAII